MIYFKLKQLGNPVSILPSIFGQSFPVAFFDGLSASILSLWGTFQSKLVAFSTEPWGCLENFCRGGGGKIFEVICFWGYPPVWASKKCFIRITLKILLNIGCTGVARWALHTERARDGGVYPFYTPLLYTQLFISTTLAVCNFFLTST